MLKWLKAKFPVSAKRPSDITQARGEVYSFDEYKSVYAIGDIHGRFDLLLRAERKIDLDIVEPQEALVIYLGDYVDRGPDSGDVIEHLRNPYAAKYKRICIRGNHDDVFLKFLNSPRQELAWLDFGGIETLLSYGVDPSRIYDGRETDEDLRAYLNQLIPHDHRSFLDSLPHWARVEDFVFVHAGIIPGTALEDQLANPMMWIREPFLTEGPAIDVTVVHGHTPADSVSYGPGRIGIDTGAYATGKLTVLKISRSGEHKLL